jgi:hypothetical protein
MFTARRRERQRGEFERAIERERAAVGEAAHSVEHRALTVRGRSRRFNSDNTSRGSEMANSRRRKQ